MRVWPLRLIAPEGGGIAVSYSEICAHERVVRFAEGQENIGLLRLAGLPGIRLLQERCHSTRFRVESEKEDELDFCVSTARSHRPSSACRPPTGGAGRGRRRPRSASAAVWSTPPQAPPTGGEDSTAGAPRNDRDKVCTRPGRPAPTTSRARPASAAAAGGARTCQAPPRPFRPRPVTATGTRITSKGGSIHHHQGSAKYCKLGTTLAKNMRRGRGGQKLRRRAVSAGGYPSSSQGDCRKSNPCKGAGAGVERPENGWCAAKGSAWEYDMESRESTPATQLQGSDFYYEHQDLETDSEVMQRATDFISKILKPGKAEERQQDGTLPTSQSHPAHTLQAPKASITGVCRPGGLTAKTNGPTQLETTERSDTRSVRRPRRKCAEKVSMVSTKATADGGSMSTVPTTYREPAVVPPTTLAANTADNDSGQQQPPQRESHKPGATTDNSACNCEFPFPPGGAGQDLHDGSPARGGNEEIEADNSHASDAPANISSQEAAVGCSVSGAHNAKQRKKQASHALVTPLTFDIFCSMRPAFFKDARSTQERPDPTIASGGARSSSTPRGGDTRSKRQQHRTNTPLNAKNNLVAASTYPVGDLKDRTAACTWTSVFGAVCAGAERGRARAEVLKAARREALRRKRRRRCAATAATVATAAPAVPSLKLACDVVAYGTSPGTRSVHETNDRAVNNTEGQKGLPATKNSHSSEKAAETSVTDGGITSQDCFLEGQGGAVKPESSPLFRHPFGGGTTRIGVNAPRTLQVCPGERGFRGVPTKTSRHCFSSARRQRSREGQCPSPPRLLRPSPRRRPAAASGAACSSEVVFGAEASSGSRTDQEGFAGGVGRGVRPETACGFFSKGAPTGKSGARWPSGSDKKWVQYLETERYVVVFLVKMVFACTRVHDPTLESGCLSTNKHGRLT